MVEKAVLFEIENIFVRESKEVSKYYFEAVRSTYGFSVEGISVVDYKGLTVQETLIRILEAQGLNREEINKKIPLFLEELPYAHYNIAGHDSALLMDGAKPLLERFKNMNNYVVGVATGQLERILKNMFDRAHLNFEAYFKFGAYGEAGVGMSEIINSALMTANKEFGVQKQNVTFVSNIKEHVAVAHSLGIKTIGLFTDGNSKKEMEGAGADNTAKGLGDCARFLK